MGRLGDIVAFVVASALALIGFSPAGRALAGVAYDAYGSMTAGGTAAVTAALVPLVIADAALLLIAFATSFLGGVRLPSGLPQVFCAVAVPFTLAAMQQRFFELAGTVGGLAERFGAVNFVATFLLSIAVAQLGVQLARWRHESAEAALATRV